LDPSFIEGETGTVPLERALPPPEGDEREVLVGWLNWQRGTVHRKCAGIAQEAAHSRLVGSSALTVASVISHLRWAEWHWFERSFLGEGSGAEGDTDGGWEVADVSVDDLLRSYAEQCARSQRIIEAHPFDMPEAYAPPGLPFVSLRWIIGHVLEETARHLGHLDLLREAADGQRGY
jgi:uncharacterized damage-inducible protein DinB